jgi:hypothetical protein
MTDRFNAVSCQYLSISNSTATSNGLGWYAGTTSTNGGTNTLWNFLAAPYRYWVGGSNTWNTSSTANWSTVSGGTSGASVPTGAAGEYVFIDSNSGSPTVTLSGSLTALGLITTGAACTITGTGTLSCGNFIIGSSTNWTGTGLITLNNSYLNTNNVAIAAPINFSNSLQTSELVGNFITTNTTTFSAGTLNLANYSYTTNTFSFGSGTSSRTITPSQGQFYLTGLNGKIYDASNFNLSGVITFTTSPTFNCTYNGSTGIRTFDSTYTASGVYPSINVTSGSDTFKIIGYHQNLNYTGFSGTADYDLNGASCQGNLTLAPNISYTSNTLTKGASGNIFANGSTTGPVVTFNSPGSTFTLLDAVTLNSMFMQGGILNLNNYNLTTNSFSSIGLSSTNYVSFGTGQMYITGSNSYVVSLVSGTTYPSNDGIINLTYSGSVGTRILTNTNGNSWNYNVTSGSDIIEWGVPANNVNFTGFSGRLDTKAHNISGNLTFSGTMTTGSSANAISFTSTSGTKTITNNGVALNFPVTFNGIGGTWQFQDAFNQNYAAFTLTNGTVKFKDGTTNIIGSFITSGTNKKYLSSTVPGSITTLSHPYGQGNASYLDFRDTVVVGQMNAYLANNNTNSGNNSGWDYGNDFFNMF